MPLQKLEALGSYEDINGGAHRKAASIVGPPSLVRRIGFWNTGFQWTSSEGAAAPTRTPPRPLRSREEHLNGQLTPDERAQAYAKYLTALQTVIRQDKSGTVHWEDGEDFSQSTDSIARSGTLSIMRFWWYGMRVTIRIEYHAEYVTITSILDISVAADERYRATVGQSNFQQRTRNVFKLLGTLFDKPRPKDLIRYHRLGYFQDQVWKEFEDKILNAETDDGPILQHAFGQVFADFRGMITGSLIPESPDGKEQVGPSSGGPKTAIVQTLYRPFRSVLPRQRDRHFGHGEVPEEWVRDTIKRLWPLMESDEFLRDYEFAVGGFLNGRALYISALGPQPTKNRNPHWPWTPVYYYLHAHTDDEWQLGRLVDRINTLGTLRLAATMGIGNLREAGTLVDELAKDIDAVATFLQRAIKETKSPSVSEADAVSSQDAYSMTAADEHMLAIQAKLSQIDNTVSGDIFHRLERSHSYVARFEKEARGLRERRIEGFQKYQEFVLRRMSEVFGYIELLRTRMEGINSAVAALGRQYASLKMASVTCSIDGLVASMRDQNDRLSEQNRKIENQNEKISQQNDQIKRQNDRMDEQHVDMGEQEREIRKIQEFGEIALIGALIPYYVGISIFHYMLELDGIEAKLAWLVTLTAGAAVVLRRIKTQSKADNESAKRLRPVAWVFRAYLLFIWATYLAALPWQEVLALFQRG